MCQSCWTRGQQSCWTHGQLYWTTPLGSLDVDKGPAICKMHGRPYRHPRSLQVFGTFARNFPQRAFDVLSVFVLISISKDEDSSTSINFLNETSKISQRQTIILQCSLIARSFLSFIKNLRALLHLANGVCKIAWHGCVCKDELCLIMHLLAIDKWWK